MKVILIVDDEPILREILRDCFEGQGFQVFEAESGKKAIEVIKSHKIDIVLSDIRMPGGSGVELAQSLFEMNSPKPKIILMTGYSDFSWEQAQKLNVVKMFSKPFEPHEIIEEVKSQTAK